MLYENRYKGISVYTCAHLSIVCTYFVHPYCISPIFFLSHTSANGVQVKQESNWHTREGWQTMETQTNPWCSVTLSHTSDECSSLCQRTPFPPSLSSASSFSSLPLSQPLLYPHQTPTEDHLWRPTLEATMRLGMSLFLWYPPALRLMSLYFWSHFPTSGISRRPSSALQLGISFSFIMIKLHSAWVHDKQLYCMSYIHASKEKASWAPNVCRC